MSSEGAPILGQFKDLFKQRKYRTLAIGGGSVIILLWILLGTHLISYVRIAFTPIDQSVCPVLDRVAPLSFYKDNSTVLTILHDEKYKLASVKRLSGAVQVDTQVQDAQPDVDDAPEVWARFAKFHEYLEETFPLVHKHLDVTKVNTYGLVYAWKGTDKDLKPILLTAHQDVVPVQKDTLADWTYPPFEGVFDGEYIYGRGALDCKNVLIAILETLELLISQDFIPQRTVLAAFGFDEEASGKQGATHLAKYLEKKYGKNSLYAIIDEGPGIFISEVTDTIVANVATGEKGYIDIVADLKVRGGHSSLPPDHTGIGILSELNVAIESDPYAAFLGEENPTLAYLQCLATNDYKNKFSTGAKKAILAASWLPFANSKVLETLAKNPLSKYLVRTSQAIDIFRGGEKANALPEVSSIVVNHRVSVEKTIDDVKDRFTHRVLVLAEKYQLTVEAFGKTVYEPKHSTGTFTLSTLTDGFNAAPVTPFGDDIWKELAGVTKHVYEELVFPELEYPILVAPLLMPANTDTKKYWDLTKHIFRYTPAFTPNFQELNIHSVDEKLPFSAHLQLQAWFYQYLQVLNEF